MNDRNDSDEAESFEEQWQNPVVWHDPSIDPLLGATDGCI